MDAATPIVVLGDLNDDPSSIPMEAITLRGNVYEIDEQTQADWPAGVLGMIHYNRFKDAWTLAPQVDDERAPTHFFRGKGGVLDYILVSNALNGMNPDHRARVTACDVFNEHLMSDGVGDKRQSDHGQVVVTLEFAGAEPFELDGLDLVQPPAPVAPPVIDRAGGREAFIEEAGGTFTSHESYKS